MTEPDPKAVKPVAESNPTVSFEEFKKIDLRTARIKDVQDHPNADRLWVVQVELSKNETKEIVAGIKKDYPKDALIGKTVILVNNLKPTVIRGVQSNGMLLAVRDGDRMCVLTTDSETSSGSRVS